VTARYTTPANTRTQIIEMWLDNQNTTTDRKVDIYAHGTASTNRLSRKIPITMDSGISISDCKTVLDAAQVLALSQDVGTDVIVTIYGIEEVIA
ncbi:hypothetical protein, partial [Clostridium sp. CF012]|uniref:hypothetical protein n=1 Tax=Clostridium sp. CF012 TaxID=2843319 RepID=UPI001C0B9034